MVIIKGMFRKKVKHKKHLLKALRKPEEPTFSMINRKTIERMQETPLRRNAFHSTGKCPKLKDPLAYDPT